MKRRDFLRRASLTGALRGGTQGITDEITGPFRRHAGD